VTSEGPLAHLHEHPELIDADLAWIARRLPAGSRILDVGAGRGSFVKEARRRGLEALGLELQIEAPRIWRRDGVPGVLGNGAAAPFRDACFDLVRLKEVIEHVEDPLSLVREARRLLRPGGLMIAHVPSPYSQLYPVGNFWDDYTHVRPFSRFGLQRLFADAGLQVLRIDGYVAGRNPLERALGKVLARVLPHIYRVVAGRGDE
jgi:SAM-dependent methyltransferase